LSQAINSLADPAVAMRLGSSGPDLTKSLTWETVVESLLSR
jgi:hypothetical protein